MVQSFSSGFTHQLHSHAKLQAYQLPKLFKQGRLSFRASVYASSSALERLSICFWFKLTHFQRVSSVFIEASIFSEKSSFIWGPFISYESHEYPLAYFCNCAPQTLQQFSFPLWKVVSCLFILTCLNSILCILIQCLSYIQHTIKLKK